jgi:hypothetical protein
MLAKEGCGRTARVVGMTNASHPTVTEGEEGNDRTDAAGPRPSSARSLSRSRIRRSTT